MEVVRNDTVEWGVVSGNFECGMGSITLTGESTKGVIPPPLKFAIGESSFLFRGFPVEGSGVRVARVGVCGRFVEVPCVAYVCFSCCEHGVVLCLCLCLLV